MRGVVTLFFVLMFLFGCQAVVVSVGPNQDVIALVEHTGADIERDAPATLEKITAAEHPYQNKDDTSLYVFVYDTDVTIVAHPKKTLVGRNFKGKPDLRGKMFRDDIVRGALAAGTGWVEYAYQKPGEKGLYNKSTYYKMITGSDGKQYVVCAGVYR